MNFANIEWLVCADSGVAEHWFQDVALRLGQLLTLLSDTVPETVAAQIDADDMQFAVQGLHDVRESLFLRRDCT